MSNLFFYLYIIKYRSCNFPWTEADYLKMLYSTRYDIKKNIDLLYFILYDFFRP